MQINVLVLPQLNTNQNFTEQTLVVLDILRATSTIVTALANGAMEVIPVTELAEVYELAKNLGAKECLTAGERKGYKPDGFNLGNSPTEYTSSQVNGKKIIMSTSNGTKAIKATAGAAEVLIGSFLNFQTVVDYLKNSTRDLTIICSGREGALSLEDLCCAGAIAQTLEQANNCFKTNDAAKVAIYVWEQAKNNLESFIRQTNHGQYLISIGMDPDLASCTSLNQFAILPRFSDGRIRVIP